MEVARQCVELREHDVVGFGLFGDISIQESSVRYFRSVFDYLKEHSVNVTMYAGASNPKTISTALHYGGATRISGEIWRVMLCAQRSWQP